MELIFLAHFSSTNRISMPETNYSVPQYSTRDLNMWVYVCCQDQRQFNRFTIYDDFFPLISWIIASYVERQQVIIHLNVARFCLLQIVRLGVKYLSRWYVHVLDIVQCAFTAPHTDQCSMPRRMCCGCSDLANLSFARWQWMWTWNILN